jgi:Protein of unknown function (DUF1185).
MAIQVRKIVRRLDESRYESGIELPHPHRISVVAAVIANPYPPGYVEALTEIADEAALEIGRLIAPMCVEQLGEEVEAFGKAAIVGVEGDLEEGSALIHNLHFGNRLREIASASSLLPAAEKVALAGTPVDIPLKHKTDASTRSHHQTFTFSIADAPGPREIVVACVVSNSGRPLARLATFGSELTDADRVSAGL